MDFSEITICDRELFCSYLLRYGPQASELTFTNLFMWRDFYRFRYAIVNDLLCIIAEPRTGEPFAHIPVGACSPEDFADTVLRLRQYFTGKGWQLQFKKVTQDELERLRAFVQQESDILFDRDNSDYVYLTKDLIELKGKKFHGKRNHVNRFLKTYAFEYVPLDDRYVDACKQIMEDWCSTRNCECIRGDYCERYANIEVLENFEQLGCKGGLIRVNGRFEAFTVGERLNHETAVIHIEKANFDIHGLYPMINQQFCEKEWSDTTYINREQDLGQEGLRKAKLSYNPVKMIDKYSILIR